MPWTASARRRYARPAARYATDLTDAEFALLAPPLPAPSRLGRPREVDLREVLDAILYLLRTGCPWRLLPKEFPPKSTVFGKRRQPARRMARRQRLRITGSSSTRRSGSAKPAPRGQRRHLVLAGS